MVSFPTSPIQCNYLTLGNHRSYRRPYNLYCVGADVKPCSISHLTTMCVLCYQSGWSVCLITRWEHVAAAVTWRCWPSSPDYCSTRGRRNTCRACIKRRWRTEWQHK